MIFAPQELRTYFITTVTAQRFPLFRRDEPSRLMFDVLQHYRAEKKYALHAFVIMPDHLHLCLTPAEDVSLEKAMQLIKGGFSFRLKQHGDVWMRGFNEAQIRTREKFVACRNYIEENPVRSRLCNARDEYASSSAACALDVDEAPLHLR